MRHIADVKARLEPEIAKADKAVAMAEQELRRARNAVADAPGGRKGYSAWITRHPIGNDPRGNALAYQAALKAVPRSEERLAQAIAHKKSLRSAAPYFENLPTPIVVTKTDADGRFEITIPDQGDYIAVATSGRRLVNTTERYYWIITLKPTDSKLTLSNDNLTSSGTAESLLNTE